MLVLSLVGNVVLRKLTFRSNVGMTTFLGVALMAVGSVGTFFGSMIKAGVSRQREFLADASAVQFTRDPAGLAGALKKIGGLPTGATIENAHAPEASHLFFSGGTAGLMSLFAMHPPLSERILRLDPAWDGQFVQVDAPSSPDAAPDVVGASVLPGDTPKPVRAEDARPPAPAESARAVLVEDAQLGQRWRLCDAVTKLYESPDGWSRLVGELPRGSVVTLDASDGGFARVTTDVGLRGYVGRRTPVEDATIPAVVLVEDAELGQRWRLCDAVTKLYESPDGWSRLVGELPRGSVVTLDGSDGGFATVTTDVGLRGYVARRTPVAAVTRDQSQAEGVEIVAGGAAADLSVTDMGEAPTLTQAVDDIGRQTGAHREQHGARTVPSRARRRIEEP